MAGRMIGVQLNGERGLLFNVPNVRLATAMLQRFMPQGSDKLTYVEAAQLVFRNDMDAVPIFLLYGTMHEDPNRELREVEKWMDKELRLPEHGGNGRKMTDLSRPILRALKAANVIDFVFDPIVSADGQTQAEVSDDARPIRGITEPGQGTRTAAETLA